MTNFKYTKLSPYMTPLERAKLVMKIQIKAMDEAYKANLDETDEKYNSEISAIVAACPNDQAREYNKLIRVKEEIWNRIVPMVEITLLELENAHLRISTVMYLIATSPMVSHLDKYINRIPTFIKKQEHEKAVVRAKKIINEAVLELNGRHGVIQQEAFYRLVKEKYITEYDLLDEWLWWMDRYGKSKKQLLKKSIKSKKDGLKRYLKERNRVGDKVFFWKSYAKFEGMSDDEIASYVKKHDPEDLIAPDDDENTKWEKALEEEEARIQKAIGKGKLVLIKNTVKRYDRKKKKFYKEEVEGIQAGSYYTWKDRYQPFAGEKGAEEKGWNPLSESCIELRHIKDKGVVYAGDPGLTNNDDSKSRPIAILPPNEEHSFAYQFTPKNQQGASKLIEVLMLVKLVKMDFDKEVAVIKFRDKKYREIIKSFVKRATDHIQYLKDKIALVERLEEHYFDRAELLPRDISSPLGIIPRAELRIKTVVIDHNESFSELVKNFNETERGVWDCEFYKVEELLIPTDIKANNKTVDKEFEKSQDNILK